MGGSGGSDYRDSLGGVGRRGDDGPSCATLSFVAPVMSPVPEVVLDLEIGTLCEIILEGTPKQLAVYTRETGDLLGAITERWKDLTACIDSGHAYEAEVIALGPVRVRIRPRPPYLLALPFEAILVDIAPDLVPSEGNEIDLAVGPDGHTIAVTFDRHIIGYVPAQPVALPDSIRLERVRAATVDAVHVHTVVDDQTDTETEVVVADITVVEVESPQ
ncbi:hypothetical protein IUS99_03365 [Mycobacteroides abscessus subsp. massiliense]|uniref:hypothetical protein n=1 Tax=Mycobacteroides abscessus TaxID=36809 RepID=UPI0019D288C5|nr:hypothetical protein [Mycobacteroides abscessus]MBN7315799.1 hypothetical protein [Mycobacteroides abscessus subsp. massiliense]